MTTRAERYRIRLRLARPEGDGVSHCVFIVLMPAFYPSFREKRPFHPLQPYFKAWYIGSVQYTPRLTAIGYRRVSTGHREQNAFDLADQDLPIQDFCRRHGLTLAATFIESAAAENNDRHELAKALALAKSERAVLVVSTPSAPDRRLSFIANLVEEGIPFACADAPDDEPFILHVKASFVEHEARKTGKRTKLGTAGIHNLTDEGRKRAGQTIRARAQVRQTNFLPRLFEMHAAGESVRAVAAAIGVSPTTVSRHWYCPTCEPERLPPALRARTFAHTCDSRAS